MFIAAREVFGGEYIYFQDNFNDSPKWTADRKEAMRFETAEDAVTKSDRTGVYVDAIVAIEVTE